ncbi:hypothetical protein [Klebsiella quasipneumoniae]|uniref:hypothetical protein n=1 Tax=Klebsiella quasipneumoniae TaxID=1463165 RepID=UPI00298EF3D5|nr:hypothetical protein [Klebsiella quasipneumoniae]
MFIPGLDKSVQESIKGIRENYQRDRAPYIRRLTDAQSRALEFTDEEGRYYLKGFGAKSLEDHFESLKKRVNTLYKAKAIFLMPGWILVLTGTVTNPFLCSCRPLSTM